MGLKPGRMKGHPEAEDSIDQRVCGKKESQSQQRNARQNERDKTHHDPEHPSQRERPPIDSQTAVHMVPPFQLRHVKCQ
jgi:hypothetical protein